MARLDSQHGVDGPTVKVDDRFARTVRAGFCCVWLAGLGAAAVAAEPDRAGQTFVDRVEVSLLNVDVWVTDAAGEPVVGLRREDFAVRVDGVPVEVTHFAAGQGVSDVQGPGRLRLTDAPLQLAVVVDIESTRPAQRRAVLAELGRFVRSHLPVAARVLLATLGGDVVVRRPFTSDPDAAAVELDALARIPAGPKAVDSEARFIMASLERMAPVSRALADLSGRPGLRADRDAAEAEALAVLEQIRALSVREREWARYRLIALARFVGALGGVEGRTALVLVGGGFGNRPGERLLETWVERFPDLARERNVVPAIEAQALDLDQEVRAVVEQANASLVSFYTIDAGDPSGFAALSAESGGFAGSGGPAVFEQLDAQASLLRLAHDTGGVPLAPSGGGPQGFDATVSDRLSAYSLGFSPPLGDPGAPISIDVRVSRDGVRVRHRRAIQQRPTAEQMATLTLASLYFGDAANPLGVTVESAGKPSKIEGRLYEVPILVKVPLGKLVLLPDRQVHRGSLTLYIGVKDSDERVAPVNARSFPVEIANEELAAALQRVATFTFTLQMRPGPHTVSVTVRDELAAQASTAMLKVGERGRG